MERKMRAEISVGVLYQVNWEANPGKEPLDRLANRLAMVSVVLPPPLSTITGITSLGLGTYSSTLPDGTLLARIRVGRDVNVYYTRRALVLGDVNLVDPSAGLGPDYTGAAASFILVQERDLGAWGCDQEQLRLHAPRAGACLFDLDDTQAELKQYVQNKEWEGE